MIGGPEEQLRRKGPFSVVMMPRIAYFHRRRMMTPLENGHQAPPVPENFPGLAETRLPSVFAFQILPIITSCFQT